MDEKQTFLQFLTERNGKHFSEQIGNVDEFGGTRPFFSVLVRTHARPETLHQTLASLAAQDYPHFEVIVVEDGKPTAQDAPSWFPQLKLCYFSTGAPVGRCVAGNLAMQHAKGEYYNFLDDDDYFLPHHLAVMAEQIASHPTANLFHTGSVELRVTYPEGCPQDWQCRRSRTVTNEKVDFQQSAKANQMPIQSVAFRRDLFLKYGGLDVRLNAYEDWDLWVRYLQSGPAICDARVTSLFKVEDDLVKEAGRILRMKEYRAPLLNALSQYVCDGENAGKIAHSVRETPAEQELDALREQASALVATATAVAASRKYRMQKPVRALLRKLGSYSLAEDPHDFKNLFEYHAFLVKQKKLK